MAASPELNKTSTVIKQFVVDYTSPTFEPLMEHEVNGLDYRYVYGNDRLSVNITGVETSSGNLIENGNQIRLYYHMDYLGTTDYLTSPVSLKVTSWTHYNEWGEITHNAVLKSGKRELDLVKRYATHDYDAVLNMYYAKARMYDAENRRFASVDPVKGRITEPMTMVQYLYVVDNPLGWVDLLGRVAVYNNTAADGGGTPTQKDVEQAATDFAPYSYSASNYTADKVREHDMLLGIAAAVIINSGKSAGMVLQLLKEFSELIPFLPGDDSGYNFYEQTSDDLRVIETGFYLPKVTFKDSYYAGKALGDLISAAAAIGMAIKGLAEVIVGANGTAAGLLASATGVGAIVGVPAAAVNVAAVIDGVASGVTAAAIAGHALGNFGDDLGKFDYYKKLLCENKAYKDTKTAADTLAQLTGGSVSPNKTGYTVEIPNGRKPIVVRFQNAGSGGRTAPYYRVSVDGKGSYTVNGILSNDRALTHIDLADGYLEDILTIIAKIKSGG